MKISATEAPELSDAACKKATGKSLKEWFAALDKAGGLAKGRRELTNLVYEETEKDAWWASTVVVEYEIQKGQKEKDGKPTGYSICATKTVEAPVALVYAAFTEPGRLNAWLGPESKADVVDGGRFSNGDGDCGTYKRVRKDKDLRFTWERADLAKDSLVDVMFADKGKGKTGITLNHTRIASRADADRVRAGWGAAFDRLKDHVEKKA